MRAEYYRSTATLQNETVSKLEGIEYINTVVDVFSKAGMYTLYATLTVDLVQELEARGFKVTKYQGVVYIISWE